jgi:peptide/nickel transport system permease protein
MQAYIVRRVLALIPTLFFASLIVFVTVRMIPGDVIDLMLSQNDIAASKMGREQLEKALGLDQPMWVQYGRWVGSILFHGDFGRSLWQNTPVTEQLLQRLPVTFELGLMAHRGAVVAIPIGVYSAIRQDTAGDYVARSLLDPDAGGAQLLGGHHGDGLPVDLVGLVARVQFVPFHEDPWAEPAAADHPGGDPGAVALGHHHAHDAHHDAGGAAPGLHPHGRAKGLGEMLMVTRHALRNALIPVVTLIGCRRPS